MRSLATLQTIDFFLTAPRNDLLPRLDLAHIPLDELGMPAREIRKLDPSHGEVAKSIGALGFYAPILPLLRERRLAD